MKILQSVATKIPLYYQQFMGKGNAAILARGAASSFFLKILGLVLLFGVQVLAARLLGADGLGNYAYVLAWMNILVLLGKMGLDTTSVRFISTYYSQQQWGLLRGFLSYSNKAVFTASVGAAFCMGYGAWIFRNNINSEVLYTFWVASVMLPPMAVLNLQEKRLMALRKVWEAQYPQAILRPLIICVGFAIFFLQKERLNESTAMVVTLIATISSLFVISLILNKSIPQEVILAKTSFNTREWVQTGKAMILIAGFQMVLSQTDIIMIGTFVGSEETGLYTVASKIASLLSFSLVAMNSILAPLAANLYAQQSRKELQRVVSLSANSIFLSTLLITTGLVVWGKVILSFFGVEFVSSYSILIVLIVGQMVNALAGPVGSLLSMTGYHNDAAKTLALSAIVNIVLNAILIPNYEAIGASVATAVSTILWNAIMVFLIWYRLKLVAIPIPKFLLNKLTKSIN